MSYIEATSSHELREALSKAGRGDTVRFAGVIEVIDPLIVGAGVALFGCGPVAVIRGRGLLRTKGGVLLTKDGATIANVAISGGKSIVGNGAALWHDGGDLTLSDCRFLDSQNGVMIGAGAQVRLSGCVFSGNGGGCGHTHGIYVNATQSITITECCFENTIMGHHIKSRAAHTRVERSYFSGEPGSTTSYSIDVPEGGKVSIRSNFFVKTTMSKNRAFISYCSEGRSHAENGLDVSANVFVNHRPGISVGVVNHTLSVPAALAGNAFEGVTLALFGRGRRSSTRISRNAIGEGWLHVDGGSS